MGIVSGRLTKIVRGSPKPPMDGALCETTTVGLGDKVGDKDSPLPGRNMSCRRSSAKLGCGGKRVIGGGSVGSPRLPRPMTYECGKIGKDSVCADGHELTPEKETFPSSPDSSVNCCGNAGVEMNLGTGDVERDMKWRYRKGLR